MQLACPTVLGPAGTAVHVEVHPSGATRTYASAKDHAATSAGHSTSRRRRHGPTATIASPVSSSGPPMLNRLRKPKPISTSARIQ